MISLAEHARSTLHGNFNKLPDCLQGRELSRNNLMYLTTLQYVKVLFLQLRLYLAAVPVLIIHLFLYIRLDLLSNTDLFNLQELVKSTQK